MNTTLVFLLFITVGWGIMFLVHSVAYIPIARVLEIEMPHWPLVLALLSVSYFAASVGVRTIQSVLADYFYFVAATWLGVVFLLFSFLVVYELAHLTTGFDSVLVLSSILVLVGGLSTYALVQGRALVVQEHTVPIESLEHPIRVVHLSDIHVGTVHQRQYLQRVVAETNALHPDIILITGDLFDGSAPIDEEILTPLNELKAPSFFSNGNHEEYEGLTRVKDTIRNLDLQLLDNTMVEWEGIQLIGVNDRQSLHGTSLEGVLGSIQIDEHKPTLLMYHSPSDWNVARKHGVDLMLSGHTHNGQIYPFNVLVRLFFNYMNGIYTEEGKHLHVSPGTGTWGPPMRLGSRNQITLLHLRQ